MAGNVFRRSVIMSVSEILKTDLICRRNCMCCVAAFVSDWELTHFWPESLCYFHVCVSSNIFSRDQFTSTHNLRQWLEAVFAFSILTDHSEFTMAKQMESFQAEKKGEFTKMPVRRRWANPFAIPENEELLCGIFSWKPKGLQIFNNMKVSGILPSHLILRMFWSFQCNAGNCCVNRQMFMLCYVGLGVFTGKRSPDF